MAAPLADETQPLLAGAPPTLFDAEASAAAACREEAGRDSPRSWPAAVKWSIVLLLAFLAFVVTFTCISIVPVAGHVVRELDGAGAGDGAAGRVRAASVLLVTIWELGEAAGPLAIAPLSEAPAWGRARVLRASTALFALATAAAALAPSTALLIAARGLTGVAVATNVLSPAIVGDLFPPPQRGSAMALVSLTPLLGGAVGPALGGALADSWGWRAVLALSTALALAACLLVCCAFPETYAPAIRHARCRRRCGKAQGDAAADAARPRVTPPPPSAATAVPGLRRIRDAVLRPALLLADSLVLALLALFGAVLFSFFYVMSVSLPDILENRYGLSSAATGSSFLVFSAGSLLGVIVCNRFLDPLYGYLARTRGRVVADPGPGPGPDGGGGSERAVHREGRVRREGRPELKLPLAAAAGVLLPAAVAAYGWCAERRLPLPWLLLAVGAMGASMLLMFIPVAAYVVDAFGLYAASAMTAVIVSRCLCGTFLPLAVAPLVAALGYGWGFTVLAAVGLAVVPIPFAVFFRGDAWRQRSPYTRDA